MPNDIHGCVEHHFVCVNTFGNVFFFADYCLCVYRQLLIGDERRKRKSFDR